ncbi:alcohol oxidase [Pleurotus eryngii]|uniref:Alcohol oxidase n=1 Tax=Pleurotus eryngii TaxID=5323 RepID=A0A9P6D214_PLEER|nr:alcohol oxidase [Pleurotus eryngii]
MSTSPVDSEYDIVFAGGGTVACVAAGRLAAADPTLKILLIEQGPHTRDLPAHIHPARFVANLVPTSKVFTFHVAQPSDALLGRAPVIPAGRCVGGGSSVNFMMYTRASASDYDDWETVHGNEGWGSKDLIPLLQKVETYQDEPSAKEENLHGYSGPIKVSFGGVATEAGKQFMETALAYDKKHGETNDPNDFRTINAYARWMKYIDAKSGRRSDAAHYFVYNQDGESSNLHVLANTAVHRLIIKDHRAVGVEYTDASEHGAKVNSVYAKRLVVVSAGAFGSPAILQRSGIGAKQLLKELDISEQVDLPGVGENYQDHNLGFATYFVPDSAATLDVFNANLGEDELKSYVDQWVEDGDGLLATNGIDGGIKLRPSEEDLKELGPNFTRIWNSYFKDAPDKPVMIFVPFAAHYGPVPDPKARYMSMLWYSEYPESKGRLHITSGDDWNILRWAYKRSREIARRMPLYRGEVQQGHPTFAPDSDAACIPRDGPVPIDAPDIAYTAEDNEAIHDFLRNTINTTWHSMGTCAMKPRDRGGVVDSRLNVYGMSNLKVADVRPQQTSKFQTHARCSHSFPSAPATSLPILTIPPLGSARKRRS